MKDYYAKEKKGNHGIYLSFDYQMDEYLNAGWEIYEEDENGKKLIATPEDGFKTERPVFPAVERMQIGG